MVQAVVPLQAHPAGNMSGRSDDQTTTVFADVTILDGLPEWLAVKDGPKPELVPTRRPVVVEEIADGERFLAVHPGEVRGHDDRFGAHVLGAPVDGIHGVVLHDGVGLLPWGDLAFLTRAFSLNRRCVSGVEDVN